MSGCLRLARVRRSDRAAAVLAVECDGALYDLAAAEEFFSPNKSSAGSDFFQRVISMQCDGMAAVAERLRLGRRPTEARLWPEDLCPLVPMDTQRSVYIQTALPGEEIVAQRRDARALLADRWPVPFPAGCERPFAEVGVALLLGDDLHHAEDKEALRAILGLTLVIDWASSSQRWQRPSRDVPSQLGSGLLQGLQWPILGDWSLSLRVGQSEPARCSGLAPMQLAKAVAQVSHRHRLLAGDVVAVRLSGWIRPGWREPVAIHLHDRAGQVWLELQGQALPG